MNRSLFPVVLCATGCAGGALYVVQQPISDQCASAGLNGCGDLTQGALLYAEGNQAQGRRVLTKGVAANMDHPDGLEDFAKAIQAIGAVPGASQYVAALQPAADLILRAAKEARAQASVEQQDTKDEGTPQATPAPAPAPTRAAASLSPSEPPAADTEAHRVALPLALTGYLAGDVDDSGRTNMLPCKLGDGTGAWCVSRPAMVRGYIAELVVSAACDRDVFILEGSLEQPHWLLWVPAGSGLSEHTLRLSVPAGGSMVVGMVNKGKDTGSVEWPWRCGVTWSAMAMRR